MSPNKKPDPLVGTHQPLRWVAATIGACSTGIIAIITKHMIAIIKMAWLGVAVRPPVITT
jgi:hypothetical protein